MAREERFAERSLWASWNLKKLRADRVRPLLVTLGHFPGRARDRLKNLLEGLCPGSLATAKRRFEKSEL
jgi:hypothetical protein